jgi:hypothetical protein
VDRKEAHALVDKLFDMGTEAPAAPAEVDPEVPKVAKPEGKRVVRTRSSGDRVYYLDDTEKTRQWVYSPEVLESLGFDMNDVGEVEDSELLKYRMGAAILKPVVKDATTQA